MARIRSVHPGLFTDDAFMTMSDAAQVVLIGIWTEADDNGIFAWKPATLRARIRPAKDGSMEVILSELEEANCIKRFSSDGREFGAVRNFRKYQRPKSPNSVHVLPDEFRNYVGLSGDISEKPPQREDGGGRVGDTTSGSDEPEGGGARKRARPPAPTRLPKDWKPSQANTDFAKGRGVPEGKIQREADRFRANFLSKGGDFALRVDWDAAWDGWILDSCERRGYVPLAGGEGAPAMVWIGVKDSLWGRAVAAYHAAKGKHPVIFSGEKGEGFYFPAELVGSLKSEVAA